MATAVTTESGERLTRLFTMVVGVVYLLVGIVGFVPALYTKPPVGDPTVNVTASYGYLLGLFPVNALHDVVHLLVGVAGIAAARRFASARAYCQILFVVYGLLSVLGFIPQADTLFGLVPIYKNDVWLHAATALAAGYFGFVAAESSHIEGVEAHH